MREIKFRAKTTVKEDKSHAFNNVWVEGDLIVSNGRYYIHPRANKVNVDNDLGKFIVMHEVQKDTVCQYTGLKDKNGKEIYEGDIVKFDEYEYEKLAQSIISEIKWCEELCSLSLVVSKRQGTRGTLGHLLDWNKEVEVIGNIFDNPELLEGGAE